MKNNKPIYKKWWAWIIAIFLIIGFIGSGQSKNDVPASTDEPSSIESTTPKLDKQETPQQLSNEGVSSDVKIAVTGFETKDTVGNNQFSTAKAQGIFKIVKLSITNNQKDAITIDTNSFKLIDDQKREFSASSDAQMALMSSTGEEMESFFLKEINPGISLEGYIVFDVPKDAKGFVLKAHGGMLGKEITLKVE